MDSSDEELRSHRPGSIRPYQFEPLASEVRNNQDQSETESEESVQGAEGEEGNPNHGDKIGNTAWCDCQQCESMPTQTECVCCHEIAPVRAKIEESDLSCITEHEGFTGNCLNRHVVETAMYAFEEEDGPIDDNEPIHELYRYIAYRSFTRWIWHILGRGRRKVIPSCAVLKIRSAYPSEQYTGFKYPRP